MKESVASCYVYKGVRNENTAKQKSVGKTAALMEKDISYAKDHHRSPLRALL